MRIRVIIRNKLLWNVFFRLLKMLNIYPRLKCVPAETRYGALFWAFRWLLILLSAARNLAYRNQFILSIWGNKFNHCEI